jgi:excisionase family DNA binding protein
MRLQQPTTGWWNLRRAATHSHLSVWRLYRAIAAGELRHVRVGGRRTIRTKRTWVDAWLRRYEH